MNDIICLDKRIFGYKYTFVKFRKEVYYGIN